MQNYIPGMRKGFLLFILFATSLITVTAQRKAIPNKNIPAFNLSQVKFDVPFFLPGIMKDSTALLQNDTLEYTLTGQFFDSSGFKIVTGTRAPLLLTPWQTLIEMADAYSKKDARRISDLYDAGSKQKINSVLSGSGSGDFLNFVSKAAAANLRIIGGIQYKNGFLAFTHDDIYGLHQNFIILENNKYKLSALDDKSATGWNLGIYFKYAPQAVVPIKNVVIPDSLGTDAIASLKINLPPNAGPWVALFYGDAGGPVTLLAQDNGTNDYDPAKNQVTLHLRGAAFINTGTFTFYIIALNYPVTKISKSFLLADAQYSIKITE